MDSRVIYNYSMQQAAIIFASLVILFFAFQDGIGHLILRWNEQEEYSHGFMIPMVTAYLLWHKREFLKRVEFKPSWLPVGLVALGLVIAVVGELSALFILIHFSLILILLSMAWALMGWHAFKHVMLPLGFLVFAIPLPYFLEATLTAELQLISTNLGVAVIRLFNIPVFAEGNVIDLGSYKLQVVEACSGLRYLYPLMGVGFITAYMYQAEIWKRAVIFLSTIPITILMNSFRIGVIGILVEYWGTSMAEGFLHYFEGWIIFIACLGVLVLEMLLLNKVGQRPKSFAAVFALPEVEIDESVEPEQKKRRLSAPFIVCTVMVLAALAVVSLVDRRDEAIPERKAFVSFPAYVENWRGEEENLQPIVTSKLQLTDYLLNNYIRDGEPPINLYVAYYESQRKGVSPHSPRVCIPGGGWSINSLQRFSLDLDGGREIPVNRVIIQNGLQQQLVYYWFRQRGRDIANEYWMKWYLLSDSIAINRTDGSLVRVTTPILPGENLKDGDRRLQRFISAVDPMLGDYIPD